MDPSELIFFFSCSRQFCCCFVLFSFSCFSVYTVCLCDFVPPQLLKEQVAKYISCFALAQWFLTTLLSIVLVFLAFAGWGA